MKRLYLVRHAKSSWKDQDISDFERPLNKRGKRDAPFMGKLLRKQGIKPDLIITSPANRALTTAKIFCEEMNYHVKDLLIEPKLYAAPEDEFLSVLSEAGSDHDSVMIISHNPGLTDLANYLAGFSENIPTASIVALDFDSEEWGELEERSCTVKFFEYPKKYFPEE